MYIVQLPRGAGKTTYAVDWLRQDRLRVLITPNTTMKRVIQEAHADVAHQVLSADTLYGREGLRGFNPATEVGIDELDLVLTQLLGMSVSMATLTPSEEAPEVPLTPVPAFDAGAQAEPPVPWFKQSTVERV